jgi:threonine/homoserine efflux transporter RhtA
MLRKYSFVILIALILIVISAWSPWLTPASAEARAVDSFNTSWQSVADGCGINCKGCGAVASQRVPFGVRVTIEFACGLIPADSREYHRQATAFVSALGTVHGLPKP